jgi:hypothetical protein
MGKEREGKVVIYNEKNSRTVLKTDSIVDGVIDQLIDRANVGKTKYNTDLDRNDLSTLDWLNHLQQELLDGANYIEKLKKVMYGDRKTETTNRL